MVTVDFLVSHICSCSRMCLRTFIWFVCVCMNAYKCRHRYCAWQKESCTIFAPNCFLNHVRLHMIILGWVEFQRITIAIDTETLDWFPKIHERRNRNGRKGISSCRQMGEEFKVKSTEGWKRLQKETCSYKSVLFSYTQFLIFLVFDIFSYFH